MTNVLVSVASKHGATAEIAQRIADVLRGRGLEVTVTPPEQVDDPGAFEAIVLGSAVYAGRWLKEAKDLAERLGSLDPRPAVWLFSSGPIGDPPKPEEDPVDVVEVTQLTSAREHRVLAGKLDKSVLGFAERAIVIALRAPEGDFRDWEGITAWAGEIAATLERV